MDSSFEWLGQVDLRDESVHKIVEVDEADNLSDKKKRDAHDAAHVRQKVESAVDLASDYPFVQAHLERKGDLSIVVMILKPKG